jgi:hypothetical protein
LILLSLYVVAAVLVGCYDGFGTAISSDRLAVALKQVVSWLHNLFNVDPLARKVLPYDNRLMIWLVVASATRC